MPTKSDNAIQLVNFTSVNNTQIILFATKHTIVMAVKLYHKLQQQSDKKIKNK